MHHVLYLALWYDVVQFLLSQEQFLRMCGSLAMPWHRWVETDVLPAEVQDDSDVHCDTLNETTVHRIQCETWDDMTMNHNDNEKDDAMGNHNE